MNKSDERALRMLAIQIAAQLPDDPDQARLVLDYVRELMDGFLKSKPDKPTPLRAV